MMNENDDVVIKVEGLWKRYGLPLGESLTHRLKRYGWAVLRGPQVLKQKPNWGKEDGGLWALRDINFDIRCGDNFGVIGRNGSGKSTLLKVLAQTSPPTYGKVIVIGRIFSMIELAAGMNPELTGRENVRLLATVMGFSPRWAARKMPDIEDFCELEDWFDRPVWQYSSGMIARLGFAVAMNVDSDILLVDEVMAVGDLAFQQKALERMERVHHSGKTIVFISHNLRQVERLCNRTMWLEHGQGMIVGNTNDVITSYEEYVNEEIRLKEEMHQSTKIQDQEYLVKIISVRLFNDQGMDIDTLFTGSSVTIELEYETKDDKIKDAFFGIGITTTSGDLISGFSSELATLGMTLGKRGWVRCLIPKLLLLQGVYSIRIKVRNKWGVVYGSLQKAKIFKVVVPNEIRVQSDFGKIFMDVVWLDHDVNRS